MAIYLMNERVAIKEAIALALNHPSPEQRRFYNETSLQRIDGIRAAVRLLDPETCTPEEVRKTLQYVSYSPSLCLHCGVKGAPLAHFTYSQTHEDVDVDLCADCLKAALKVLE